MPCCPLRALARVLIAVAPHRAILGVEPPGHRKKVRGRLDAWTYDWRDKHGSPGNTAGVRAQLDVLELAAALAIHHGTDAHLVTYVVSFEGVPLERQPRVNKRSLDWMHEQGFEVASDVLMVDVDNPQHGAWTAELRSSFDALWAKPPPALTTCGVYLTRGGYRLVQPLDEPIAVAELERYIVAWFAELEGQGIPVDWRAKDWTRLYRLPHVVRDRKPYRSPLVDLARMAPRLIDPAPKCFPRSPSRGSDVHRRSPRPRASAPR